MKPAFLFLEFLPFRKIAEIRLLNAGEREGKFLTETVYQGLKLLGG